MDVEDWVQPREALVKGVLGERTWNVSAIIDEKPNKALFKKYTKLSLSL